MNLIEQIIEQYELENFNTDKASESLIKFYDNATKDQQTAINRTLIAICGWSLKSLLRKGENLELDMKDFLSKEVWDCKIAKQEPRGFLNGNLLSIEVCFHGKTFRIVDCDNGCIKFSET